MPTAAMEHSRTSPGTSYRPRGPLRSSRFERCRSDRYRSDRKTARNRRL